MYKSTSPVTVLAVAKNSTVRAAKDLEGKAIAVLSLEGPTKIAASAWLDKNGINPSTVKFIELPSASMAQL